MERSLECSRRINQTKFHTTIEICFHVIWTSFCPCLLPESVFSSNRSYSQVWWIYFHLLWSWYNRASLGVDMSLWWRISCVCGNSRRTLVTRPVSELSLLVMPILIGLAQWRLTPVCFFNFSGTNFRAWDRDLFERLSFGVDPGFK